MTRPARPAEPAGFVQFWASWYNGSQHGRRAHYAEVAAAFTAIGAFQERQRLIAAGWIEPWPIFDAKPATSAQVSWPFQIPHDHEPQAVTGLSIPETPV